MLSLFVFVLKVLFSSQDVSNMYSNEPIVYFRRHPSEMFAKKIKHQSSKYIEMLDGEKVGHLNIGYTILYNIMLKIVYNVELLELLQTKLQGLDPSNAALKKTAHTR